MSKGIDIKVKLEGFDRIRSMLENGDKSITKEVDANMLDAANKFVANAKRKAPGNNGGLRRGIGVKKVAVMNYEIFASARYSGYIEFGTGRRYKSIAGFEDIAASIRGATGATAEEAIDNIKAWVRRKGIRFEDTTKYKSGKRKGQNKMLSVETTAYFIFHYIMINGIKPQPFFFQNVEPTRVEIEKNLGNIERALKI